jgi:hypothetical protein
MEPTTAVMLTIVGLAAAWGVWYGGRAFLVWRDLRGDRIVTCPETHQPAAVRIDIASAITGDAGSAGPRLEACSRWAERGVCDGPCANEAQAPESAASALVREWSRDKTCVMCGTSLSDSAATGHHIALREPSGMTREWVDIAAERLPVVLTTSLPMCWNCHVAETFRRMYPDLVIDRDNATVKH